MPALHQGFHLLNLHDVIIPDPYKTIISGENLLPIVILLFQHYQSLAIKCASILLACDLFHSDLFARDLLLLIIIVG